MAGFDYELGRSNNMVAAEERGMVTIGRWAKRHGVSAAAAVEIMRPYEAHHTGTGRRGRSRLTPVIDRATEPTAEQLAAMQAFDRGEREQTQGAYLAWQADYSGPYGRKRFVPVVALFAGDAAAARKLKEFTPLSPADYEWAKGYEGNDLRDFRPLLAARQREAVSA